MKRASIFIFTFLLTAFLSPAQNQIISEAEDLYNKQLFLDALPLHLDLLKADPNNALLNYKTGVCYMNSRSQKHKAIPYLEHAVSLSPYLSGKNYSKDTDAPPEAYKLLGDAYQATFKFEAALTAYDKYKAAHKTQNLKDTAFFETINRKMEMCVYGKEFEESASLPTHFNPARHLDSLTAQHDTVCGKYSSKLSADGSSLVYTFKIPLVSVKLRDEDERYFEPPNYIFPADSTFLAKAPAAKKKQNGISNDTVINMTTIGASADGQMVLSYKDDKGRGNVYLSRLIGNNWTVPEKLQGGLNNNGWEYCENVSHDGSTLYFVSNRPGGLGGNDIYKCKKLPTGEWSKAINLGPGVNSPFNDEAPFIHPDGITLYFSSNRNNPSSAFDNFVVTLSENESWTKPLIVGYPVDKGRDKAFYQVLPGKIVPESNPKKITATKKLKKDTLKNSLPENDNFMVTFSNGNKNSLMLLTGKVTHSSGQLPAKLLITVSDNIRGEVRGLYYPDKNGHYAFIVPPGINNNITYEAEASLFLSDNIIADDKAVPLRMHYSHQMKPLAEDSRIFLNNIFFKADSSELSPFSKLELNNILRLMRDNPQLKVKIANYIFSRDNKKDLKKLSEERAEKVSNYLIEQGINKKRIAVKGYKKSEPNKADKAEMENFISNEKHSAQWIELQVERNKSK